MAKAAAAQEAPGMGKDELKKNFRLAKRQEMQVGLMMDGAMPCLMMHKIKKGRALAAELKKDGPDLKDMRFGVCTIDPENAKRAIFQINKPIGGLARKMIKALKGTGINKVHFRYDDGSAEEHEESEEEEEENEDGDEHDDDDQDDTGPSQTRNPEVLTDDQPAQADASSSTPADGTASAQQSADPQQANGQQPDGQQQAQPQESDASGLIRELTGLVKRMMAIITADPSQNGPLGGVAKAAQGAIQQGDLVGAAQQIQTLTGLLGAAESAGANAGAAGANGADTGAPAASTSNGAAPPNGAQPNAGAASAPLIAKARQAWVATRQKVESDLDKLHGAFGKAFQGHDMEDQITKAFRDRVDTVLNALDSELSDKLDAVNNANGADRDKLVTEAKGLLQKYQQTVQSNTTIQELDNNPFVPMSVQKTMTATLAALEKTIR